ncbi:jg16925 [Pararge aegeria aegeria]|uniref:Jg16925 protein n=1 Tax=Pararge aegeria aegeria TaxID=348720 RepID=A0A8S4SG87_9NEOP|nr:jg16925 [Pararge aegeria aegeria]
MGLIRRLRITQRAMKRPVLRVFLRVKIRSLEIRRRTRVTDIAQRVEAEVAMGGAHSSEERWTLGSQGAGMAAPRW